MEPEEPIDDEARRVAEFSADLSDLSRRHGITIGGCGCCGSPFLSSYDPGKTRDGRYKVDKGEGNLEWVNTSTAQV